MLAPMAFVLLLVVAYPLVDSFVLSLHRVNLGNPGAGAAVCRASPTTCTPFSKPSFWYSVQRTFYFTLISVAMELALGLLFALLLNESFRGRLRGAPGHDCAVGAADGHQRRAVGLDPQPDLWRRQYAA